MEQGRKFTIGRACRSSTLSGICLSSTRPASVPGIIAGTSIINSVASASVALRISTMLARSSRSNFLNTYVRNVMLDAVQHLHMFLSLQVGRSRVVHMRDPPSSPPPPPPPTATHVHQACVHPLIVICDSRFCPAAVLPCSTQASGNHDGLHQ
eukprot:15441284-Alexandrium_andersonii.AAC.1